VKTVDVDDVVGHGYRLLPASATFKGDEGQTVLDIYYGIPMR